MVVDVPQVSSADQYMDLDWDEMTLVLPSNLQSLDISDVNLPQCPGPFDFPGVLVEFWQARFSDLSHPMQLRSTIRSINPSCLRVLKLWT
jgi:hypothetical protein